MITGDSLENFVQIALEGSFYIVTLVFVGFTLSIAYHWFSYGTNRARSVAMLITYLGVSAVLFIGMIIALANIA